MSDAVPYTTVGEWLEEHFPNAIIRVWSDGDISVSVDHNDMTESESVLQTEDLPGDWVIETAIWSKYGVELALTRSINLGEF